MSFSKSFSSSFLRIIGALCWFNVCCHAVPVEKTVYNGLEAFRLSDGKTEAVVVPALSGRVMSFKKIGGANWLWNAPPEKLAGEGYKNYGGDKTFVGPHPVWNTFAKELWPPDPSWDGGVHGARILPGEKLETVGKLWCGFGVRVTREFSFAESGEFLVSQTVEKLEGEPRMLSVWPVTQLAAPDAVFLSLNPNSAYARGFHPFGNLPQKAKVETLTEGTIEIDKPFPRPTLLKITPHPGAFYKLGADSPVASIAAVKNGVAFVQRAVLSKDGYPDGAEGAGFPIEFYHHGAEGAGAYVELELLSPLRRFVKGSKWTHTVRWSLHTLPSRDANAPQTRNVVERLFKP